MKSLVVIALSLFSMASANAIDLGIGIGDGTVVIGEDGIRYEPGRGPGSDYGRRPPGRGLSCQAVDAGWEEHFGGHNSCRECLRHHGNCIEKCSSEVFVATARGIDRRGRDRRAYDVDGYAYEDRWQAERSAIDECQRRRLNRCQIVNVRRSMQEVSRQNCGRRGRH